MDILASQPYSKTHKEITSTGKTEVEYKRTMHLYENEITTKHREFPIEEVIDMSFRPIGADGGLLYLHTTSSVYSYTVQTSPEDFIKTVKSHIRR